MLNSGLSHQVWFLAKSLPISQTPSPNCIFKLFPPFVQVNANLKAALVPPFVRASNFLDGLENWSSGQMLDWILHFSLPCLADKWSIARQQHWACLVKAVHLLSLSQVSEQQLQMAQECIDVFLRHLDHFYPKDALTLPLHLLTHLVEATRRLGPLWATASNRFHETHQVIKVGVFFFLLIKVS